MQDWTDKEVKRFSIRVDKMLQEGTFADGQLGISLAEAEVTAMQMLHRDRDPQDDRRVCFECHHLDERRCRSQMMNAKRVTNPVRIILQRCEGFKLKGK